ncbi:hypothetical protein KG112_05655 [Nocardioides sp. zg-ZUI104]|uniref:hypothetical protein n=1 Tax=Nocardioides faecalis TaxID=2803858 RepID=UPI001BCE93E6|nr:hypothetical protein [Nocardioides faecalis]MBS4752293.1 hypothetical protein [Nocardioides faecalis]
MTKRPPAVELACWLLWLQMVAGALVCLMVVVRRDDLGAVWSPMQVGDSTVQPVEFVPVILVLYACTAVLAATCIMLLRSGHDWARYALAAIAVGIFVICVATVRTDPPALVDASAIAGAVLSAVTLVFLLHPQTHRFLRDAAAVRGDTEQTPPGAHGAVERAGAGKGSRDA